MIPEYEKHSLAKEIPPMNDGELNELRKSICADGFDYRYPIYLFEGKILVGWSRYQACLAEEIEPCFEQFTGNDPLAFIIRSEFVRRTISTAKKLAILEKLRAALHKEALIRQRMGGVGAEMPQGRTNEKIAQAASVSETTAKQFHAIQEYGSETLKQAVSDGEISISDAAAVLNAPKTEQNAAIKAKRKGTSKTVREALSPAAVMAEKARKRIEKQQEILPVEILDSLKSKVPESLHEIFEKAEQFKSLMRQISKIKGEISELCDHPAGKEIDRQDIERSLDQARTHLRFALPYTECSQCRRKFDKKCACCHGRGWVTETQHTSSASDADKAWLEKK